jgi:hypothetical protein
MSEAPFQWIIDSGKTFAVLPIRCEDGQLVWLRWVHWADVNTGMFYSPYTVERVYRLPSAPASGRDTP